MSTMMEEILNYNKARHAKEAIVWRLYVAYVQAYDYIYRQNSSSDR